ncbi:MAG: patatin-like phospholipase family protein [Thermicanus sp.]|nr:patatin-like phospholipase family protein [Thermicanus sp.]
MRPKIGLALGSGGVRGYAHIGVLKVFEENGIPIDYVVGSSMGSIVSVLYANRINLDHLSRLAIYLKKKHLFDYSVPRLGFIKGEKIKEMVRLLTQRKRLEDLYIPTAVVATDLTRGERFVFREGPIDEAVRASIAIPGIFEPVQMGDRLLVDGGVIERVPVPTAREMGADLVIGVDVSHRTGKKRARSIFEVIMQTIDIMDQEIFTNRASGADLLIQPNVGHFDTTSFELVEEIIQEGERAAREKLKEIEALIQGWGIKHAQ